MRPFTYARAENSDSAVKAMLEEPAAAYLAGGTTLIDLMKLDVMMPARLIDVGALPLAEIALKDGNLSIGAMARNSDVAEHALVRTGYPVLAEALLSGASPQLRNMATVGGNLLQRTRCSYFRDTVDACNKRHPGSGCAAQNGYTRMHAILGGSPSCIAVNPSDMCVALLALDATISTRGKKGERQIPIADFHLLPGDHPERETVLEHGDLITSVTLPSTPFSAHSHYLKVRDRASYAFALTSAAVALAVEKGVIREARIALGGVATKPWRAFAAEKELIGKRPSVALYKAAGLAAVAGAQPHRDNAFKVALAQRTVTRALQELGEAR